MVGTYGTSSTRDQWAIVEFIWGSTYPNLGGDANKEAGGIEFASNYTKDARIANYILSLSKIKGFINSNKPMLTRLQWNNGGGHAIVFSGYNEDKIRCIDPWEDTPTTYYSYDDLKNGGDFLTGSGKVIGNVYYK